MIDIALGSDHPWMKGIDRKRLEGEGHVRLNFNGTQRLENHGLPAEPGNFFLPFAEGVFPTRSGKAELYSEQLASEGVDPIVSFIPPQESRHSPNAKSYPLEMLARKADNFLNSTFTNVPSVQKMEERDVLEISQADARLRDITSGDRVRVFNARGEIYLTAKVDGAVQPGVVAARLNWAKLSSEMRNVNVLTSERLTDLGASATFYSVLVEVQRAANPSATSR
jgi:anaerobic selenocysteine-containing dehydrogenase